MPSRTLSNGESDFPCFFVGNSEVALGTCPACSGRHRPRTYAEGCNKSTTSIATATNPQRAVPPWKEPHLTEFLLTLFLRMTKFIMVHRRLQHLDIQACLETMPRERPTVKTQSPEVPAPQKDTSTAMNIPLNHRRNSTELLKLQLKRYHMSPTQFSTLNIKLAPA